jgi:hypothetical protein
MRVLRVFPINWSTLLLVAYLLRACLLSRSLAMALHVTISSNISFGLYFTVWNIQSKKCHVSGQSLVHVIAFMGIVSSC